MQKKKRLFLPPELQMAQGPTLVAVVQQCLIEKNPTPRLQIGVARGVVGDGSTGSTGSTGAPQKIYHISISEIDRSYAVRPYETTEERIWRQKKAGRTYSTRVLSRLRTLLATVDKLETELWHHLAAHSKTLEAIKFTRHRIRRAAGRTLRRARHIDKAIKKGPLIWHASSDGISVDQKSASQSKVSVAKLNTRAAKIAHSVEKHNRLVARHSQLTAQLWTPEFRDQHAQISSLWSEIHQDILAYDVTDEVELGQLVLRVLEAEPLDPTEYERMCDSTDEEIADSQSDSEAATETEILPQKTAELPTVSTLATTTTAAAAAGGTTTSPDFKETTIKTEAPISDIDTADNSLAEDNERASTPTPTYRPHQYLAFSSSDTTPSPNTTQNLNSTPVRSPNSSSATKDHVSEEAARLKESIMEARRQRLARESASGTTNNYAYSNNTSVSPERYRKYQCDYCDSEFRHSKYFRRHLLTHRKPFACSFPECDKSYTRKDNLERHVANIHKKRSKH